MLVLQLLCWYCYSDIEFCYNCHYERVIDIARIRDTATLKLLLLTSFAAVATAIAYADASVGRVALLTVFKVTCCCYRICYYAICYYERVIAIARSRRHCYAETATANDFCCSCYRDRLC